MKILETQRLVLRHQVPDDLDSLWAIYCDPEMVRYIPDAPTSYNEAREELEWHQHGHPHHPELGLWATVLKENGKFIGRCGLLPWDLDGRQEVEVAYLITREYWGQGLGTEAARGIVRYATGVLGLTRLVSLIDPQNLASRRVAEKIGMQLEKELQDEHGQFQVYALEI